MRWLLEWLFGAVGPGRPEARILSSLRAATVRVRRRAEYHRAGRGKAQGEFDRTSRRVRFLELSQDAEVSELVQAHQELLRARNILDHHERRLQAAEALHEMMRSDRVRLKEGREPEHRDAYAAELDG